MSQVIDGKVGQMGSGGGCHGRLALCSPGDKCGWDRLSPNTCNLELGICTAVEGIFLYLIHAHLSSASRATVAGVCSA